MKFLVRAFATIFAGCLVLNGCKGPAVSWCERDPLDDAAGYRWLTSQQHYFEPLNAWVRHESLEAVLMKAYREGGLDALRSRYGFDCRSRVVSPPCETCFTCRRTIRKTQAPADPDHSYCQIGEMTIQADIGPQWTMTAMTYWDRLPVGTKAPDLPPGTRWRPR